MIRLTFVCGGSIRNVLIEDRKISMLSKETNFIPMVIDLNKLDVKKIEKDLGKEGLEQIKEIAKLNTEEEMAEDIKKDFQRTGWRMVRRK